MRLPRLPQFLGPCLAALAAAGLSACSSLPGGDGDVAFTSNTQSAVQLRADAIKDDLGLGKYHFRARNYGLAELHFRRAVETSPGQAEGWIGLAASYDQLKRWELADRAYAQALKVTGPTAAFLNNRGYSFLLRGDMRRASEDLSRAAALDPTNERIQNNLKALDGRVRSRRA
jgi:Flp pilus assembly protein TadD